MVKTQSQEKVNCKKELKKVMEKNDKEFFKLNALTKETQTKERTNLIDWIKMCREGDSIVWDEPNGEVFKITVDKKYPKGWSPKDEN